MSGFKVPDSETPVPEGVFNNAKGIKSLEQASRMLEEADKVISANKEKEEKMAEMEEQIRELTERMETGSAGNDDNGGNHGQPQTAFDPSQGWDIAEADRRFYAEFNQRPLESVGKVTNYFLGNHLKPVMEDMKKLRGDVEEVRAMFDWAEKTEKAYDVFGEDFMEGHKKDILGFMKKKGGSQVGEHELIGYLYEIQNKELNKTGERVVKEKEIENTEVEGPAAGSGTLSGKKWTRPDGTEMSAEEMEPFLPKAEEI